MSAPASRSATSRLPWSARLGFRSAQTPDNSWMVLMALRSMWARGKACLIADRHHLRLRPGVDPVTGRQAVDRLDMRAIATALDPPVHDAEGDECLRGHRVAIIGIDAEILHADRVVAGQLEPEQR